MTKIVRMTMTSQVYADWYLWNVYKEEFFAREEYIPELGNPVEIPHSIIPHNRPAPVAWSGTNYHK